MIIYISRGLLNSLIEAKRVMSTIASENELLQNRVIINTYAVVDGTETFRSFANYCVIGSYINTETHTVTLTQKLTGIYHVIDNRLSVFGMFL